MQLANDEHHRAASWRFCRIQRRLSPRTHIPTKLDPHFRTSMKPALCVAIVLLCRHMHQHQF